MLKYCLVKNLSKKNGPSHVALTRSIKTVTLDEFMQDLVDEGTGLTRPQALAYFEKMTQLVKGYLEQGFFVSTPLFRFRTSITGIFDVNNTFFNRKIHKINVCATPGIKVRKIKLEKPPIKVNASYKTPVIYKYIDHGSNETNSICTSKQIATLSGHELTFDKSDLRQGIFFESVAHPDRKFRASLYSRIKPSEIIFMTPELEPGEYKIIIYSETYSKMNIRSGTLKPVVKVL